VTLSSYHFLTPRDTFCLAVHYSGIKSKSGQGNFWESWSKYKSIPCICFTTIL